MPLTENRTFRKPILSFPGFPGAAAAIAGAVLSFPAETPAKVAAVPAPPSQQQAYKRAAAARSSSFIREFESRVRPFLENRVKERSGKSGAAKTVRIAEEDLLRLVSLWKSLSPEFKALYKTATQLPGTYDTYVSPGGHFEVYYIPLSRDSVNGVAETDTITCGIAGDWRPRLPAPNGVPDLIDEIAWALDSVWSMEVDGLGFIAPIPCRDSVHTSDRYPVVVTALGQYDYGYTWPDTAPVGPKGYPSHVELRNRWDGEPWTGMGYEEHPENGIRVTCAHEFFHAIQYAMTWNVVGYTSLDDFPLGWIEGTAVFMEELGFDDVNDYLQYSGLFFSDPGMPFFKDLPSYDMRIYSNSLLLKYLYEKNGGIGLLRTVHFSNYDAAVPFHPNLRAASLSSGPPWTLLLNRFHAASYYTGARADTALFLADAGLMGQWSSTHDVLSPALSVTDSVRPYGMRVFSFAPAGADRDTADFRLQCAAAAGDTAPYPTWGASCIIRKPARPDSIVTLAVDSSGSAVLLVPSWKACTELLLLVTNGVPSETRNVTVYFMTGPGSVPLVIFPNPGRLGAKKCVRFEGSGIREIRIYSMDGTRVASNADRSFIRYINGYMWLLVNSSGAPVVPGCYTAVVVLNDAAGGGKKAERRRVMVFP